MENFEWPTEEKEKPLWKSEGFILRSSGGALQILRRVIDKSGILKSAIVNIKFC